MAAIRLYPGAGRSLAHRININPRINAENTSRAASRPRTSSGLHDVQESFDR
jgi:hypothetical protein